MKTTLRERMKRARLAMSKVEVRRRSALVVERFLALEAYGASPSVMAYLPVRNEVDATVVMTHVLNDGKVLVLPRMDYEANRIVPHRVTEPAEQLVLGRMGLVEPDAARTDLVAPEAINLVAVPGLVFDRQGNRIGWGRGYYDAFLAALGRRARRIGLAYDFQVVDSIEHDGHDIPMDVVVTEHATVEFR
ncbi:MAG: 5-formyltetrahydrofolate cyclo-ligase [Verrucomicrobia bacterium]|nr:5-formyltetrahydrofolate cyclo-ligase [Verrucomicrobiota bacterium]